MRLLCFVKSSRDFVFDTEAWSCSRHDSDQIPNLFRGIPHESSDSYSSSSCSISHLAYKGYSSSLKIHTKSSPAPGLGPVIPSPLCFYMVSIFSHMRLHPGNPIKIRLSGPTPYNILLSHLFVSFLKVITFPIIFCVCGFPCGLSSSLECKVYDGRNNGYHFY